MSDSNQQAARDILSSKPKPVEVWGALFILRNVINAPAHIQDAEFLIAVHSVEGRKS